MNSGITKNQIKIELSRSLEGISEVEAVFGFGSFFRDEPFNDVDLALVFSDNCVDPLPAFERVMSRLKAAEENLGVRLHVTPLTAKEFQERPLLDHERLVPLCRAVTSGENEN
jgi:predicted nucleotidyltransferase